MGTNYYVEADPCPHCGRGDGQVHFMKSFRIYQGYPEDYPSPWGPIRSVGDWAAIIGAHGLRVVDEYGELHDARETLNRVAEAAATSADAYEQHMTQYGHHDGRDYQDPDGYWFTDADFS
jgi:hypothetical protein